MRSGLSLFASLLHCGQEPDPLDALNVSGSVASASSQAWNLLLSATQLLCYPNSSLKCSLEAAQRLGPEAKSPIPLSQQAESEAGR